MSRAMPFFKCYAGDFLSGIRDLTPVQTNAYIRLIFRMYDDADGVFGDSRLFGRMIGSNAKGWEKIRDALLAQGKIVPVIGDARGEGYINIRALTEMMTVCAESRKRGKPIPHNVEQRLGQLCPNLGPASAELTAKFSNFLNEIKAPKESLKIKLEKTPNPLKGDDAALGLIEKDFKEFYDGYPLQNKRDRGKALAQWAKLDAESRELAVLSLQRANFDFSKQKNGGPTPAVYLRARWFDRYAGKIKLAPTDPQTRKLYDAVLAQCGVIGWTNFFEGAAQVKGNRIIAVSDFRRGLIAERYAELIKREGFELVSGDGAAPKPKQPAPNRAELKAAEAPLTAEQRAHMLEIIKKPMIGSGYKPPARREFVP